MIGQFVKDKIAPLTDFANNTSPIDVISMRNLRQLYCSFINKPEKCSPVARYAKGEEANKRSGETLRMKQRIIGVLSQAFDKSHKLALLHLRQLAGVSLKLWVEYYLKHFADPEAPLGTSSHSRIVWWGQDLHRVALSARIQGDSHPRGLSRRCLSRTSEAFSPLFQAQSCSYRNNIPTKQKINEVES